MMKKYIVFILIAFASFISVASAGSMQKRVFVLGIDGMDYGLLTDMINNGEMPNFAKLKKSGDFKPLLSSIPPQSPVAWSNFITGMDPGGHGIFDFIHREPKEFLPYLSTTRVDEPTVVISLGKYRVPLTGEKVELLRRGRAFWEILENEGIPSTIVSIPANFPPVHSGRALSGMGTPDILGTYGTFIFLSSDPEDKNRKITGGVIQPLSVTEQEVDSYISGPPNKLIDGAPPVKVPLKIFVDKDNKTVLIKIQNNEILLREGEWSNFIKLKFKMIPAILSVSGIVRFHLKQAAPYLKIYISPVNIDPSDPAMPISYPEDYAEELYKNIGYYYTQGMAEDTKAMDNGILNQREFLDLAQIILDERINMLKYELGRFKKGFLFFYISTIDLSSHMFFNRRSGSSISGDGAGEDNDVIRRLYKKMDGILAIIMNKYITDNDTLIVMSDHGFSKFDRQVNLNSWLVKEGYASLLSSWSPEDEFYSSVDWPSTRAYALGLNGLYINLRGREKFGTVEQGYEYRHLVDEIASKLEKLRDPRNGELVIKKAYKKYETYRGKNTEMSPDIIVGYSGGYRSSDESALGQFSNGILSANKRSWKADHCMDYREVPGIILSNKKIKIKSPALYDLAPTILKEFNLNPDDEMVGRPMF